MTKTALLYRYLQVQRTQEYYKRERNLQVESINRETTDTAIKVDVKWLTNANQLISTALFFSFSFLIYFMDYYHA